MRIARFRTQADTRYGVVEKGVIHGLRGDIPDFFTSTLPGIPAQPSRTEERWSVDEVTLLAPCLPSKIVAVGLNYRSHAEEIHMQLPQEPLLFLKPSTAVIGPGEAIMYPPMSQRIDYEAELAVIIGALARNVSEEEAKQYILGYTCFNDVTARDLQGKDKQFTRSKSFDTFAPMGPWIETELDPGNLKVQAYLGGELRQSATTADLIFPVQHLVSFVSRVMTLLPGDVIATGTPAGIGPMQVGDCVDIVIEGIGTLQNRVAAG